MALLPPLLGVQTVKNWTSFIIPKGIKWKYLAQWLDIKKLDWILPVQKKLFFLHCRLHKKLSATSITKCSPFAIHFSFAFLCWANVSTYIHDRGHITPSHLTFTIFLILFRWIDGTRVSFKDRQGKLFHIINAMNENPLSLFFSIEAAENVRSLIIMPSLDAWVRPEKIQNWYWKGNKLPNSFRRFLSVVIAFFCQHLMETTSDGLWSVFGFVFPFQITRSALSWRLLIRFTFDEPLSSASPQASSKPIHLGLCNCSRTLFNFARL